MPAQLVVIAAAANAGTKTKDEKKTSGPEGAARVPPARGPKYPPYRRPPVGVPNILGQTAVRVGHFEDVATLLDQVRAQKPPLGPSNTIFASVKNLGDVQSRSVRSKLAKLPKELTIVVHEGKGHG